MLGEEKMGVRLRLIFLIMMALALFFGFLHLFIPPELDINFNRLHIFLFNLCSGGTILIYFTEDKKRMGGKSLAFMILAICYALLAFLKAYLPAMAISIMLAVIVESVRIKRFQVFPSDFFKPSVPASEKFHQASLLCLSVGLIISGIVILNNEYLKLINLPKLQLDTFFLGFSFPLSLITMAVMFSHTKPGPSAFFRFLYDAGFWAVTGGVTIFFAFIIFEQLIPQVVVTTILFLAIVMIMYLFYRFGIQIQQKYLLTSGMFFLLFTAVTGILYIVLEFSPEYHRLKLDLILRMHTFAALYGWNLNGLAVICRRHNFPIKLHSSGFIAFHWFTVIILAPLGTYYRLFAVLATLCYVTILYLILLSGKKDRSLRQSEPVA
jgi:hypothetical protein